MSTKIAIGKGKFCPYKKILFCQEAGGCNNCQIYIDYLESFWEENRDEEQTSLVDC